MYQPAIFIRTGDYAASQKVITQGTLKPSERLSYMLNIIGEQRIMFGDSIRIKSGKGNAVMYIRYISRTKDDYVAFIDLFKEKDLVPIYQLPEAAIVALTQRLRIVYANKLHNFSL